MSGTCGPQRRPELVALGFCGIDDSVHPHHLAILARSYPKIEFGVLFRPDREGTPRYASSAFVEQLARTSAAMQASGCPMKLAAHLCSSRVNDLLDGTCDAFLDFLLRSGFQRVQINATAVNGVDTSRLGEAAPAVYATIQKYSNQLEFIIQKNQETEPLWSGIERLLDAESAITTTRTTATTTTRNVAMLVDESKGTGVLSSSWPVPTSSAYMIGYAGGIGPSNVSDVLADITHAVAQSPCGTKQTFWIDMESSLRSIKNGRDTFDLDKCYAVIDAVGSMGLMERPCFLE
jgi:hypothetical protein